MHLKLFEMIRDIMPQDLDITFTNLNETEEGCSINFIESNNNPIRKANRQFLYRYLKLVINYNIKGIVEGFNYGNEVIHALNNSPTLFGEIDEHRGVYITNIKLLNDIIYAGKEIKGDRVVLSKGKVVMYAVNILYLTAIDKKTEEPIPFRVKVIDSELNIREKPTIDSKIVGVIRDNGVYTIVNIQNNHWGLLKSKAGYISILPDYVKRL